MIATQMQTICSANQNFGNCSHCTFNARLWKTDFWLWEFKPWYQSNLSSKLILSLLRKVANLWWKFQKHESPKSWHGCHDVCSTIALVSAPSRGDLGRWRIEPPYRCPANSGSVVNHGFFSSCSLQDHSNITLVRRSSNFGSNNL